MSTVGSYRGPNIVTRGLVLHLDAASPNSYYSPNGGTVWKDVSGNGNDSTLVNSPAFADDTFLLDGTDNYINCGDTFPSGSQNITLSIWLYRRDQVVNDYFISKGTASDGTPGSTFYMINGPSYVRFVATDTTPTRSTNVEHYGLVTDQWYNFTYTYDGTIIIGYRDGENPVTNTSISGPLQYVNQPILIGTHKYGGRHPQADIGSFSLYNRALSAQEVLQNFNATKDRFGL